MKVTFFQHLLPLQNKSNVLKLKLKTETKTRAPHRGYNLKFYNLSSSTWTGTSVTGDVWSKFNERLWLSVEGNIFYIFVGWQLTALARPARGLLIVIPVVHWSVMGSYISTPFMNSWPLYPPITYKYKYR